MCNVIRTRFIVKNVVTFLISMAYNSPNEFSLCLPDYQLHCLNFVTIDLAHKNLLEGMLLSPSLEFFLLSEGRQVPSPPLSNANIYITIMMQ